MLLSEGTFSDVTAHVSYKSCLLSLLLLSRYENMEDVYNFSSFVSDAYAKSEFFLSRYSFNIPLTNRRIYLLMLIHSD